MGQLSDCCSYTRVNQTTFIVSGATQESACTHKIMEPNLFGSAHRQVVYGLTSYQIQLFFLGIPPPGVARTHKIVHPKHRRRMGLSDCCSYTQVNRVNFSSYQDRKNLRVLYRKIMEPNFCSKGSISRQSCCSYSQSYQYNCFFRSAHLRLFFSQIMHPTPAADGYSIVALTHKNNQGQLFSSYQGHPRFCVYSQNHGTDFIRIRPHHSSCCSLQSYQYNCFFVHPATSGVARTHKIMHPTPAADGPFQIVALVHKNNQDNFFHHVRPEDSACTHKKSQKP
jgi:hypothetical protein